MQTKNLIVCNYNINIVTKVLKKINSTKKASFLAVLFIFLLLPLFFAFITNFHAALNSTNYRSVSITDFKLDINKLSETAAIIESERISNNSSQINNFGSDGEMIDFDEISPDLKDALINIADLNNDRNLSNEEISNLGIMRLKSDIFQKKFKELQFTLNSADCNFKNYVIITKGKYAGTVLYNGPLKFIDSKNNRCFGLELLN